MNHTGASLAVRQAGSVALLEGERGFYKFGSHCCVNENTDF